MDSTERPTVTIVIPVYNQAEYLRTCLSRIKQQNYPSSSYDVVVVDNNSTQNIRKVASDFGMRYVKETEIQSPYAAKNTGIRNATGDVIAILGARHHPVGDDWLRTAVNHLYDTESDLVAGRLEFKFTNPNSISQKVDMFMNGQSEDNVDRREVAKTGNLFIRKEVIEDIGLFPEHMRSGGDVYWTGKATNAGYTLSYCEDAVATNLARGFIPLIKKSHRVGRGQPEIWMKWDKPTYQIILRRIINFPRGFFGVITSSGKSSTGGDKADTASKYHFILIMIICYLFLVLGRLRGVIEIFLKNNHR